MPRRRPQRPAPAGKKDRRGRLVTVYHEQGAGGRQFGRPVDVLLIYPQPYPVGMSNLGFLFVYRRLREFPEVNVERAFLNDDGVLTPTVESGRDWRDFPVLALACAYEPDLLRWAHWAQAAGLELDAAARAGRPWLLAGGSGAQVNPRLLAGVADLVVPARWEDSEAGVRDWLRGLLGLPPAAEKMPAPDAVYNTLFTPEAVLANMLLLELHRGCRCRCPFCWYAHATALAPPLPAAAALALADRYPAATTVGLISATLADYPELPELLAGLRDRGRRVGFASLRLDRLTPELIGLLAACGMRTLTIAPESGAARWKKTVGKEWPVALLRERLTVAARAGIQRVKLYYMYGFPGETAAELQATGDEVAALAEVLPQSGMTVEVAFNPLTPKPGTPWAALPLPSAACERETRRALEPRLRAAGVAGEWGSRRAAELQHRLAQAAENLAALVKQHK